jgi:hypothetical protein
MSQWAVEVLYPMRLWGWFPKEIEETYELTCCSFPEGLQSAVIRRDCLPPRVMMSKFRI